MDPGQLVGRAFRPACAILPITSVTSDRDAAEPAAVDYLRQVARADRLADKVADQLKRAVLSGQLRPGDRLPPERVLGDRFGVSRTVVREAIRSLAATGLVEVRAGSGTVVARVDAARVAETLRLYLRSAGVEAGAIGELRVMLEVHAAGAAAARATDDDVRAMREVILAMAASAHDHLRCAAHDAEFHRCVARAAHNPLYLVILDSIGEPSTSVGPGVAIAEHERIVERISARDRDGAREAMGAHLADADPVWERLLPMSPGAGGEHLPELQAAD